MEKKKIFSDGQETIKDIIALINDGRSARQERESTLRTIKELNLALKNNYQEPGEIKEIEESLSFYESRLDALSETIKQAENARTKYIGLLKSEYSDIQDKMDQISKKIDVCDISMNDSRFTDVESIYDGLYEQYMHLYDKSRKIIKEIQDLEDTK